MNRIEDIKKDDIRNFESFLKLKPKYSSFQLKQNFIKISRIYHPSIRRGQDEIFNKTVIAFELLNYLSENKNKSHSLDDLISNWNRNDKKQVEEKLLNYKQVDINKYTEIIDVNPLGFRMFKGFVNTLFFVLIIIAAIVFLLEAFSGNVSSFGIIFFSLFIMGMLVRLFKQRSSRIWGDYRSFKY